MRLFLPLLFLLSFQFVTGQDKTEQDISIKFDNTSIEEVINQIEEQTSYRFYFVKNWLNLPSIKGNYNNKNISSDLF